MPRSKHPKKASAEEISSFKKISDKVMSHSIQQSFTRNGKPLRVMFQDEAGFGRINKPKRCWCRKGIRPTVPCHHVREYVYTYGAVSPLDGAFFSLVLPLANTNCMNLFLKALSNYFPNNHILLVLNNPGWHTSKTPTVPDNIELYLLLPYTPELNPIEQIWEEVREKGFRNELFKTLDAVETRG